MTEGSRTALSLRERALIALLLTPLAILLILSPPIADDPSYHAFADTRSILAIPNFANVVSNVAFLVVAVIALRRCLGAGIDGAARSWTVFFFGTLLVAFASAYYHWSPDNASLAWDRLTMTIGFMALFSALVAEHIRPALERTLLRIAIAVGIVSVVWWRYTGDLRLYVWVQFGPLVALVFLMFAFPARYSGRGYLVAALALYVLAKIVELSDRAVFDLTWNIISGHTLKHLLAAAAVYLVYLMLRERKAVTA